MSVIVAVKEKNRVVVGVDVRMSNGDFYMDSYKRRPKAIHLDGTKDIILGAVGNIALVDVFKQVLLDFERPYVYSLDRAEIVKYVIPELIKMTCDYNLRNDNGYMDGSLFLAIKNKAFRITGNYTVEEIVSFDAIGSGDEVSLGSLYTTSKFNMPTEERIKMAIEATGTVKNSVSKASYIGDTAGRMFTPSTNKMEK